MILRIKKYKYDPYLCTKMRYLLTHIVTGILVLLLLVQSMLPLWITAEFYLNQQFYYENLCINRDKPITICGGHCHLNTKLSALTEEHEEANIISAKTLTPELFWSEIDLPGFIKPFYISDVKFHYQSSKPIEWSEAIFHPPRS